MTYENQGVIVIFLVMALGIFIGYKWAKEDNKIDDKTGEITIKPTKP